MARKTRTDIEKLEYRVSRLIKESELIAKTAESVWNEDMIVEAETVIMDAINRAFEVIRSGEAPAEAGFKFSRKLRNVKTA